MLKEQFLPGWGATVDGSASMMRRWNGAFSAVTIPPGRHNVEFYFFSRSLVIGAVISVAALIALTAIIVTKTRRSHAIPEPATHA